MKYLPLFICLLVLTACSDEDFAPLDAPYNDLFVGDGPDLFSIDGFRFLPGPPNNRRVIVDYSHTYDQLTAEQQAEVTTVGACVEDDCQSRNLTFGFVVIGNREIGTEVCVRFTFETRRGIDSRPFEVCQLVE